jgi:hypothetical protein
MPKSPHARNQGLAHLQEIQTEHLKTQLKKYPEQIRKSYSPKQNRATQQGFAAEAHHAASFNVETAAHGDLTSSARLHPKKNHPKADIQIKENGGIRETQVKFYKDGEATAKAISNPKYDNLEKIGPADQIDAIRTHAKKAAGRNQNTRPKVSKSYKNTETQIQDRIQSQRNPKIGSTPLNRRGENSAESLVEASKRKEFEYATKQKAEATLQNHQYKQAAKWGAISGAVLSTAKNLKTLFETENLSAQDYRKALQSILTDTAESTAAAISVTAIQHAGKTIAQKGGTQIGGFLQKGNTAAAVTTLAFQLGKRACQFSKGEIDSIELASSSIQDSVSVLSGTIGYQLGTTCASFLGQAIASETAAITMFGASLGTLGPIAVGIAFSIIASLAASAYFDYFQSQGKTEAFESIKNSLESLKGGKITLNQYIGEIGNLDDFRFQWKDCIPFRGSLHVLGEYKQRKTTLQQLQTHLTNQIQNVKAEEQTILGELKTNFQQAETELQTTFQEIQASLIGETSAEKEAKLQELENRIRIESQLFQPEYHHKTQRILKNQDREEKEEYKQQILEELADLYGNLPILEKALLHLEHIHPEETSWERANLFFQTC